MRRKESVDVPASRMKESIAEVLKREGFIRDFKRMDIGPVGELRIYLKYGPDMESVIRELKRQSKPSRREYSRKRQLKPVLGGLGISILSTSRGVLSDREARKEGVGGEVLLTVH